MCRRGKTTSTDADASMTSTALSAFSSRQACPHKRKNVKTLHYEALHFFNLFSDKYRYLMWMVAEKILEESGQPKRTLYIAFGHDEEVNPIPIYEQPWRLCNLYVHEEQ